jgi:hypothetical protein
MKIQRWLLEKALMQELIRRVLTTADENDPVLAQLRLAHISSIDRLKRILHPSNCRRAHQISKLLSTDEIHHLDLNKEEILTNVSCWLRKLLNLFLFKLSLYIKLSVI